MKKVYLSNDMVLLGVMRKIERQRRIEYYILTPMQRVYAFSLPYTKGSYDMCKSGVSLNKLLHKRSRDAGVMRLVKRANYMVPYLMEYYGLCWKEAG